MDRQIDKQWFYRTLCSTGVQQAEHSLWEQKKEKKQKTKNNTLQKQKKKKENKRKKKKEHWKIKAQK